MYIIYQIYHNAPFIPCKDLNFPRKVMKARLSRAYDKINHSYQKQEITGMNLFNHIHNQVWEFNK